MTETIETKDEVMRRSLLAAALTLFQQYGLSKTTMEDIAKAIGKAKSSLYYYYANKEEIFIAVVEKEKKELMDSIGALVSMEQTAVGKLKVFALARLRALRKKKVLSRMLIEEVVQNICIMQNLRRSFNDTELDFLREILKFGRQSGEFRLAAKDLDMTAYIIYCSLRGLEFDAFASTEPRFENAMAVEEKAVALLVKALSA